MINLQTLIQAIENDTVEIFNKEENKEEIKKLLAKNFYIETPDEPGSNNLLIYAASLGKEEIVKALLQLDANINQGNIIGITPLFIAAEKGQKEIVERLISEGANINQGDMTGTTPLEMAALLKKIECMQLLIKAHILQDKLKEVLNLSKKRPIIKEAFTPYRLLNLYILSKEKANALDKGELKIVKEEQNADVQLALTHKLPANLQQMIFSKVKDLGNANEKAHALSYQAAVKYQPKTTESLDTETVKAMGNLKIS